MKTKRFLICLMAVYCLPTLAQTSDYDYIPFAQDGKKWEIQVGLIKENLYGSRIDGDTLIGGETWKKVYNYFQLPELNYSYYAAVRDEGKKVYAIAKGSGRPRLLYDFGMKVGDRVRCGVEGNSFYCLLEKGDQPDSLFGFKFVAYLSLERIDTIETHGMQFRRFTLSMWDFFQEYKLADDIIWLEGVGSCLSPFLPWMPVIPRDNLVFFKWCYLGKTIIAGEKDFYSDNETNAISNHRYTGAESGSHLYDLQGRRVTGTPQCGIYIQNGRKYVK